MRKAFFVIAALLFLTLVIPTSAQFNQFEGTWRNVDSNTGGVTQIQISGTGDNVKVRAWGACTPQDCDWGEVIGYAYSSDIMADATSGAGMVSAIYETSFSETIMTIRPLEDGRLEAEILTRFTDTSGRHSYFSVETFQRQLIAGGILVTLEPVIPVIPVETAPQRFFLRFSDAYLVYVPASSTLQIATVGNVLSYGSDWEVVRMSGFLYHMRQRNWADFYWKVNTSRREVYRVRNGTFGQLGGTEELISSIRVDSVDSPENPTRFFLYFSDAYLVYVPASSTLQIAAASNVLSYGGDWQVVQMQPYLYHLRQNFWADFYWKVNTSRSEAYRVRGGTFGALGGTDELLNMRVEAVP